jgi:thymidylate synthase
MHAFQGRTADEVWRAAFAAVLDTASGARIQPSRAGGTHELLHVVLEVAEPRERWVLSRRPSVNPAFGIAEVIWILAGSNDAAVLNFWFPDLRRYAGDGPVYAGAYGHRLRRHFGIDQVLRACETLAAKPESRQVVLQIWDARADLPEVAGQPRSSDVPCNLTSLLKLRDGRLDWTQVMRSNDLLRGLPHNFVQFTTMQEIMAGWLGAEVGTYHHWSDSLHVYCDQMPKFSCAPPVEVPGNGDSLATSVERGLSLIEELHRRLVELSRHGVSASAIEGLAAMPDAPSGYRNFLYILAAESARRNGRADQAMEVARACGSPHLLHVWEGWWARVQSAAPAGPGVEDGQT